MTSFKQVTPAVPMRAKAPARLPRTQTAFPLQCRAPRPDGRDSDRCAGGCGGLQSLRGTMTADYDAQSAVERNWSSGWPACCGGYVAPPQLKPASSNLRLSTERGGTKPPR